MVKMISYEDIKDEENGNESTFWAGRKITLKRRLS